jgi:lysophospholipase L1-like esterase
VRASELVLAAASVLAVCGVLEVGLRVQDWNEDRGSLARALAQPVRLRPDGRADLGGIVRLAAERRRVYELIPNANVLLYNWRGGRHTPLELNSDGFRDRDYARPKPPGVRRVVGIGDSFMFGWGVLTGEDYLSVLEARLAEEAPGRWEVLNMAVPGYNTVMEVETLKARGLAYEPDVVVVGFCWNDIDLPNFLRAPSQYLSLERSFLADFVRGRLERVEMVNAPRGPDGKLFESDPTRVAPAYRDLLGWDAFDAALDELATLAREHGFTVMFLAFEPEGAGGPERDARRRRALAEAARRGFTIVDVGTVQAEWMRDHGAERFYNSSLTLSGIDPHPSALSHALAADLLLRRLGPTSSAR